MPVPHHHHHPHHPPQHTQYHHVTIDGTGTKSYATPAIYEKAVLHELRRIHNSHAGQAIFEEFIKRSHHHQLKIIPYEGKDLNAIASPKDPLHATLKGQVERSGRDGHVLLDGGKPIVGLGGGSDSDVLFTPVRFSKFCSMNKPANRAGAQPDEVLFHEMIHAIRQMRGILDPQPLGHLYDTEEEFFAILLANIYASETGRPLDLRADHHSSTHLTTDTDATFLPKKDMTDYRYRLVHKLVHQEPRMAHELKRLKHTPFNPIRRYFELERAHVHVHH